MSQQISNQECDVRLLHYTEFRHMPTPTAHPTDFKDLYLLYSQNTHWVLPRNIFSASTWKHHGSTAKAADKAMRALITKFSDQPFKTREGIAVKTVKKAEDHERAELHEVSAIEPSTHNVRIMRLDAVNAFVKRSCIEIPEYLAELSSTGIGKKRSCYVRDTDAYKNSVFYSELVIPPAVSDPKLDSSEVSEDFCNLEKSKSQSSSQPEIQQQTSERSNAEIRPADNKPIEPTQTFTNYYRSKPTFNTDIPYQAADKLRVPLAEFFSLNTDLAKIPYLKQLKRVCAVLIKGFPVPSVCTKIPDSDHCILCAKEVPFSRNSDGIILFGLYNTKSLPWEQYYSVRYNEVTQTENYFSPVVCSSCATRHCAVGEFLCFYGVSFLVDTLIPIKNCKLVFPWLEDFNEQCNSTGGVKLWNPLVHESEMAKPRLGVNVQPCNANRSEMNFENGSQRSFKIVERSSVSHALSAASQEEDDESEDLDEPSKSGVYLRLRKRNQPTLVSEASKSSESDEEEDEEDEEAQNSYSVQENSKKTKLDQKTSKNSPSKRLKIQKEQVLGPESLATLIDTYHVETVNVVSFVRSDQILSVSYGSTCLGYKITPLVSQYNRLKFIQHIKKLPKKNFAICIDALLVHCIANIVSRPVRENLRKQQQLKQVMNAVITCSGFQNLKTVVSTVLYEVVDRYYENQEHVFFGLAIVKVMDMFKNYKQLEIEEKLLDLFKQTPLYGWSVKKLKKLIPLARLLRYAPSLLSLLLGLESSQLIAISKLCMLYYDTFADSKGKHAQLSNILTFCSTKSRRMCVQDNDIFFNTYVTSGKASGIHQ